METRPRRSASAASSRRFRAACAVLLLLLLLGPALPPGAAAAPTAADSAAARKERSENYRLPVLEGRTIDGKKFSTASLAGKRLLVLCFNPGIDQAAGFARALASVAPEGGRANFAIVGVAMGLDPADARGFAKRLALGFPILDDSGGDISGDLGIQAPVMLIGSDADRRVGLTLLGFEHDNQLPSSAVEARVRDYLRLPKAAAAADGRLDELPLAPPFEAERLAGGNPFRLADVAGKPLVLAFFLPTCPHCQAALRFFKAELARLPEKSRPALVGISIDSRQAAVESTLEEEKLDFFPVLVDPDRKVAAAYGAFAGVPDIILVDASGHVAYRRKGWDEDRDPSVMKMRLARLAGVDVPMALDRDGFSGNEACATCHPAEAAAWRFTDHAIAFDTLVTRGSDHDPKCIGCHVVGFGKKGGYSEDERQAWLEDVGCEDCHGRGGGHLDAAKKTGAPKAPVDYRPACERCHDATHSLGFDYAKFLPKVSHAAIRAMSDAQRAALVAGRDQPRDLLPASAAYVGSSVCRGCHEKEHAAWGRGRHAKSVESLLEKDAEKDPKCLRCHVTGYGRPGGFPEGAKAREGDDLARVGCESCHGPGGDHVRDGGKRLGGIVPLGDKCESCVILQICGACHDDANDPGFRFDVARKIDAQRHGAKPVPAH